MDYLQALWEQWGRSILAAIPKIVQAIIVLVIVFVIDDRLQCAVEGVIGRRSGQRELARLLGRLVRLGVVVFGLLIVLGIFNQGPIVASFIASLGVVGLVIAFALQDITKNFAAGVLLLIQRPFGLDDRIRVGTHEGIVRDINLRATALKTADGHEILIPNADVYSSAIINMSRYKQRRLDVPFTLPLNVDPKSILPQLEASFRSSSLADKALPEPPNVVAVGLDKDVLHCQVRVWVPADLDTAALTSAISLRVREELVRGKQLSLS